MQEPVALIWRRIYQQKLIEQLGKCPDVDYLINIAQQLYKVEKEIAELVGG
jgi:hypothetical protein